MTKERFMEGVSGIFPQKSLEKDIVRTAIIKDKKMYVQAGGGIVADSNPENEYQETVNKAKALMNALKAIEDIAND